MEANRINFIKTNQSKLQVEKYSGLMGYLKSISEKDNVPIGKMIILPSSSEGSPRNMQQQYQDTMGIVSRYGKPDLFVTMTCNPKWADIANNLRPWQKVENRPDLVARVFNIKLTALLNDICKFHLFGKVRAKIHVIEFQKLPHAHILLILYSESKLRSSN
uniref:Helitron helicase-like domain-containing protein n=1 Tax=Myotis myotis TaxID=51298 RepID=A0A7J8AMA7_MYOMY|nr:hypothetical protein mMyoMyo1_007887 [Myotis myotis]